MHLYNVMLCWINLSQSQSLSLSQTLLCSQWSRDPQIALNYMCVDSYSYILIFYDLFYTGCHDRTDLFGCFPSIGVFETGEKSRHMASRIFANIISGNGLSHVRCQANYLNNVGWFSSLASRLNFGETLIEMLTFSSQNILLKSGLQNIDHFVPTSMN